MRALGMVFMDMEAWDKSAAQDVAPGGEVDGPRSQGDDGRGCGHEPAAVLGVDHGHARRVGGPQADEAHGEEPRVGRDHVDGLRAQEAGDGPAGPRRRAANDLHDRQVGAARENAEDVLT